MFSVILNSQMKLGSFFRTIWVDSKTARYRLARDRVDPKVLKNTSNFNQVLKRIRVLFLIRFGSTQKVLSIKKLSKKKKKLLRKQATEMDALV